LPADLLLPLFTLTLLANAVLVAFAIRGMRSGSPGPGRSGGTGLPAVSRPTTTGPTSEASARPTAISAATQPTGGPGAAGDPVSDAAPADARPTPEPVARPASAELDGAAGAAADALPDQPRAASADPTETASGSGPSSGPGEADAVPARRPAAARRNAPAGLRRTAATPTEAFPAEAATTDVPPAAAPAAARPPAPEAAAPAAPAAARRRSRRRFALPPLDEDHEKVNRSIKTFLAGADVPDAPAVGGPRPEAEGATTIALVALDGRDDHEPVERRRRTASAGAHDAPANDVPAMVERTLRAAARGSDVVTVVGRGRFRITLQATGELAARAYLRRVRATVEPLVESSGGLLRLTIATATALDEPLEAAIERAERRLAVALASPHADDPAPLDGAADRRPERTPRAAAD
jgi:hypothetical protein